MKSIYLCGAIQAHGKQNRKTKDWRAKVKEYFSAHALGFECISPAGYFEVGENHHKTEREVMRFDLRKVRECDVLLVNLRNIRDAVGASDEIFYAYMLGKPIIGFVEKNMGTSELISYVHGWKYEQMDRIETGVDSLEKACDYVRNYYGSP